MNEIYVRKKPWDKNYSVLVNDELQLVIENPEMSNEKFKSIVFQLIEDFYNKKHLDIINNHHRTRYPDFSVIEDDLQYYLYLVLQSKYHITKHKLLTQENSCNIAEILNKLEISS